MFFFILRLFYYTNLCLATPYLRFRSLSQFSFLVTKHFASQFVKSSKSGLFGWSIFFYYAQLSAFYFIEKVEKPYSKGAFVCHESPFFANILSSFLVGVHYIARKNAFLSYFGLFLRQPHFAAFSD